MMTKEESTKILNFMTPGAGVLELGCDQINHIVKMHFLKSSFLPPCIYHTNQIYSNNDEGRVYQNCTFHDPRGRGSYARAWPYKSYSENALFL